LLRAILRFAVRNHWLRQSPFETGSPLISKADEVKRERTLTFEEANLLLANCTGTKEIKYPRNGKEIKATVEIRREHIRDLVITALDTAMRKGELLKLRWNDVNFSTRVITVTAMNSKTAKPREIGMTTRVYETFQRLWNQSPKDENEIVFGIKNDFKNGFKGACDDAGIKGLRFHDLRHTAITRMVNAGLPPMEIMKVSGHTQWTTFARYVNPNTQTVKKIADVLSNYNSNAVTKDKSEESQFVN
jgi:integrase